MKKIFLALLSLVALQTANAQMSLTTLAYAQNFNSLDTTSVASGVLPTGWQISEIKTGGLFDSTYVGSIGSSNSGNTYSFGSAGSSDRALGSVGSGTTRSRYGVGFTNNTGATITSVTITYKMEQWRLGDTTTLAKDTTLFQYSASATGVADTLASWLGNGSLDLTSAITYSPSWAASNAFLDGNLPANQSTQTATIFVTVPVGATLWLRFLEQNVGGSDDGLSVDDMNITFSTSVVLQPNVVSFTPADNAVNVPFNAASNLSINFDKNITLGSGNVTVLNLTNATSQVIAASACTASGMMVTIPNVNLSPNSSYAVNFDNACFANAGTYATAIAAGDVTTWNFSTVNPIPYISYTQPGDNNNNVPIAAPGLFIKFNKAITAGTGTITFKNLTAGTQTTFAVPSAQVVITNDSVLISPITLAYSTHYAVQFDSTCFVNGTYKSLGIYNDTTWDFNTEAAPPPPVTTLTETFTGCLAPALGSFRQYSNNGTATWRCTTFGHTDANAVSINGANTTTTFDNTDWLISPALDLSANANPYLHFWSKTRFSGATTKQLFVSSNYISGDPALATWTALPTSVPTDTNWKAINNTSLSAFKASPFVVAFKYGSVASTSAAAEEWTVDDVNITTGTVSINNIAILNADVAVASNIVNDQLQVMIAAQQAEGFTINVFDIAGKNITTQLVKANQGINKYTIQLPSMANGVYVVKINNTTGTASLKVVK